MDPYSTAALPLVTGYATLDFIVGKGLSDGSMGRLDAAQRLSHGL